MTSNALDCLCVVPNSGVISGVGGFVTSNLTASPGFFRASLCSTGSSLTAYSTHIKTTSVDLTGVGSISARSSVSGIKLNANLSATGVINPGISVIYSVRQNLSTDATLAVSYADKFAGDFGSFECIQKIYPTADVDVSGDIGRFVGPNQEMSGLFSFIDEGVFTGDYDEHFGDSVLIADDKTSYILPSSIHTNGSFRYKCSVDAPLVRPDETRIRIRASAPTHNYESRTSPRYTINEIKLEDPSGGLMVQYNDIALIGDANHYESGYVNFTTYSSNVLTNNSILHSWDDDYPLLQESSGYTLSFDILAESLDDPFDSRFDEGFEEDYRITYLGSGGDYLSMDGSPLSAQDQLTVNPTKNIRISAVEICHSGGRGPAYDDYLRLYAEVDASGRRIERSIYPSFMPLESFDTGIYPTVSSVWTAGADGIDSEYSNHTASGSQLIVKYLADDRTATYATLGSMGPINDSGKLSLKFSHGTNNDYNEITNGAFHFGFDESIYGNWATPNGAFNTQNKNGVTTNDGFFVVETVTLKVLAKKAAGSRDYVLDVVGYSDDKILNVTSAVGGFLQNTSGVGTYPVTSGFRNIDDEGVAVDALSENDQYFESSGNNAGNDHYALAQLPVVSGYDFQWYEIPLRVYDDNVTLGQSRDYTMSSMFENIYLDIYPLPSGASFANIHLLVRYKPQNALGLITEGGEHIRKISDGRTEGKLYPTARQSNDDIINAGSGYGPLSTISGIPQAYNTYNSVKTNYSRRWRGMEGTVNGPYDVDAFSFSFENDLLDFPFLSGFYDFESVGTDIIPRVGTLSGVLNTTYSEYQFKNLGWRFKNTSIFADQLPGHTGSYETIDWTSLSSGGSNFQSHPLYGKIADAFTNVVRISGHNSSIDFGDVDTANGFSAYVRFSPDVSYSGVGYDQFQSGVLLSKWDSGKDLEFTLGYKDGVLRGTAANSVGTLYTVQDTMPYSGYQYPLSVILTYSADSGMMLYTDNEFESNWTTLRDSTAAFTLKTGTSDLIVGHSSGSGVGFNMFVSELGLSNDANIVTSDPDRSVKQVTAQEFLENHRVFWWDANDAYTEDGYTLWDNINEDSIEDWAIGDFKSCQFSFAYDQLQIRTGRDLINFSLTHDGSGYSSRNEIGMPSTIDSGVAYHTQIENDFLRFNLSDTADNFYSTFRRITKDLPRGYKFADRALVVETVLEHSQSGSISWDTGEVGPKLIVSLYTKNQDPYWTPDEPNWGLVNRAIHFLEPSSCLMKVHSTFTYDSLVDQTEEWALFPNEHRISEFKEKYMSQDVDDMFLQYGLVYPSGEAFTSRIDMHTAHVRMEDAYVSAVTNSGNLNVMMSGGFVVDNRLDLFLENYAPSSSAPMNLYTIGPIQIEQSGLFMTTSGALVVPTELNLFTENKVELSESGFNLVTEGSPYELGSGNDSLNLSLFGKGVITSEGGGQLGISLTALNTDSSNIPDDNLLPMFMFASSGSTGVRTNMPIFMLNDHQTSPNGDNSGVLNFNLKASSALFSRYRSESLNLTIINSDYYSSGELNLTLYGDNFESTVGSGSLNMSTANYGGDGSDYFLWFNNNFGTSIDVADNVYAHVEASDDIRGVDIIGWGSCTGNSTMKAVDPVIETDDTVWTAETCNDGGIFRAINTYTNTSAGYSGNYYDIRKYTELIPNSPYFATMKITTGSTEAIRVPNDWEEMEYGVNSGINFSGIKLIGDSPVGVMVSGRNVDDYYGKSVAVKGDLIAVGAPKMSIPDSSGEAIDNAGSVFLYRRNADVAGQKASWSFTDQLMLPEDYRRDYTVDVPTNSICYEASETTEFCVSGQAWNIGQQGREFGHSVDIAVSGTRETIVIGAPGASWDRNFDDIEVSGIPICMIVFTDKFSYDDTTLSSVSNTARTHDVLYRYFSAPWNAGGDEFQPRTDINLLVFQIAFDDEVKPTITSDHSWFEHNYIERLDDKDLLNVDSKQHIQNGMVSGIKEAFLTMFPRDTTIPHNNIPPIVGIFKDNSPSTKNTAAFGAAVNEFVTFYEEYSYESGVVNPTTATSASGYVNTISAPSDSWGSSSISLLDDTLSTGNLIENGVLDYITSGVGQEWANSNAYEFQMPPSSGGRVFVFEKENDEFNYVQEIKSPVDVFLHSRAETNDYYGHSVSISDNSEIIAVGSPYIGSSCEIYERQEEENTRMYANLRAWLDFQGMSTELSRYDSLVVDSGTSIAQETVYGELSKGNKFLVRSDENFWGTNPINLYKKIYSYGPSDIEFTGTWQFIADFASTPRLGYSTAVSEDGNTVAFGSPTDSFNDLDDTNVYYKGENTWASYVNAGAVRMFNSRKYYPHSGVVEFYKFGNLDKTMHPEQSEFYDQMGDYFAPTNKSFTRTAFEEIEIPQSAGLAFIITPEVDAASDEVVDNIKNWLALGDRTLVVVGNDPTWEENGLYKKSNDIVNDLLEQLGSRMRIHPAASEYESLPDCITVEDVAIDKYNVTKAHQPSYGSSSEINRGNVFARGVGDIRIDVSDRGLTEWNITSPCDDLNDRCELPIKHNGDLRAEWNDQCTRTTPNGVLTVNYKKNLPFHFGNANPSDTCDFPPTASINRPGQDIIPILTAAEWILPSSYTIPARSGVTSECTPIYSGETITTSDLYYNFADNCNDSPSFHIRESGESGSESNFTPSGVFTTFDPGTYFDPEEANGRDGLIQATGTSYDLPPVLNEREVSDTSIMATEERYYIDDNTPTDSKVFLMASLAAESKRSLGYDKSQSSDNNDKNIYFYHNLVMENCNDKGSIVQLGGWTNRTSFVDAFSNSYLSRALDSYNQYYTENVVYGPGDVIPADVNVIWIANPNGKPSAAEVETLKTWMSTDNKTLVITYEDNQEIASNVEYICTELGMLTKPWFSQSQGDYLVQIHDGGQNLNQSISSIAGCANGYGWMESEDADYDCGDYCDTAVGQTVALWGNSRYIPIKSGARTDNVIHYNDPLMENYWENPLSAWQIEATGYASFPVEPGSGYRVFFNWVSESITENMAIRARISAKPNPHPDAESSRGQTTTVTMLNTSVYNPEYAYADVRIGDRVDDTTLGIDFYTYKNFVPTDGLEGSIPTTPRLLNISGCLLPITTGVSTETITRYIKIGTECVDVPWSIDEQTVTVPAQMRPIMHSNDQYCGDGSCDSKDGVLIEDGPVVVAEEVETFSSFPAGLNRSRIVVISDSTMIQGQCPQYRGDALDENQKLIRSLYPNSPSESLSLQNTATGSSARQFEFVQKIVAPERGSAAKYFAVTGIDGLTDRYGLAGATGNLDYYVDNENTYHREDVSRPKDPVGGDAIKEAVDIFTQSVITVPNIYPRYSGVVDGVIYVDANKKGGIPTILKETGSDYLDFKSYPSGYPGDLFGYDISIHQNKLIVGAPFHGFKTESVVTWSGVQANAASGLELSGNGGAGAAFYFEKTGSGVNAESSFMPWEFIQKIKPSSINVGIDNASVSDLTNLRGDHNLNGTFVLNNAMRTDQFGQSVSIDSDMVAIGAPNHGFAMLHDHKYSGSAAYIRKEFNAEFDIPKHVFYDLGSSGVRVDQFNNNSGTFVLNNGAVYTFRHQMQDWQNRAKTWIYAEKINSQGYSDRNTGVAALSGCENDFFGTAVYLDRAGRGDSDYTVVIGSPMHKFAVSGSHVQHVNNAGAAYTFDAMLRGQVPSTPNSGGWLDAQVYGDRSETGANSIDSRVYQNTTGPAITYLSSGIIFSNSNGDMFLEVSGFDPAVKGFIAHRPFVEYVVGESLNGTPYADSMYFVTDGKPAEQSGAMNLSLLGSGAAYVYNTMNLHTEAWTTTQAGSGNDPLGMTISGQLPTIDSGNMFMFTSGTIQTTDNLDMKIRGK